MNKSAMEEYYQIAAEGSRDTNHPAMVILQSLAGKAKRILDLGCGEGTRLVNLVKKGGWGIDISPDAISLAKKKYPAHDFRVGDLEKLPFKNNEFDLIYSAFVFEHLTDPRKVIGEAVRVLTPGGRLLIVCPNFGAPNRASPPYKGNRIVKLVKGLLADLGADRRLNWHQVKPIPASKGYRIDWDTSVEPYLGSLTRFISGKGLKIIYRSSCWEKELVSKNPLQQIIKYLGERNIFPFNNWGPHLLIVVQKGEQPCANCGKLKYKILYKVGQSKIMKCLSCGLVKTEGIMKENYEEYHRDEDYKKYEPYFINIFEKIFDLTAKNIQAGKVLEVGCSTGTLLSIYQKKGWEVWGVEPSKSFWDAQQKGIRVIGTDFASAELPKEYFNLVIINHTLEHMQYPTEVLKKIKTLIAKNGKIFVGVPNHGSLSARFMGRTWPYLLPDEHLYHFTPQILTSILTKVGFSNIKYKTYSGIWSLSRPLKGLVQELTNRKKSFVIDLITAPLSMVTTLLNKGTSLTLMAEK